MAGNSAGSNLEGFVYISMNAFYNAAITFTGQNYGARKYERIKRVFLDCLLLVTVVGAVVETVVGAVVEIVVGSAVVVAGAVVVTVVGSVSGASVDVSGAYVCSSAVVTSSV